MFPSFPCHFPGVDIEQSADEGERDVANLSPETLTRNQWYVYSLLAAQRFQFGKGISTRIYPGLVVSPFAWHNMMIQVPSLLPQAANLVTKGTATNVTSGNVMCFTIPGICRV